MPSVSEIFDERGVPPQLLGIHREMQKHLVILEIPFWSFDGSVRSGQIVVNKAICERVNVLFRRLYQLRFPLESIISLSQFGWIDERSMQANNTAGYRPELKSEHLWGLAVDINPLINPMYTNGTTLPNNGTYDESRPGTIVRNGPVVDTAESLRLECGINWGDSKHKDYVRVGLQDIMHIQPREDELTAIKEAIFQANPVLGELIRALNS